MCVCVWIENRSQAFEFYHFKLPWVTLSYLAKYSKIFNDTKHAQPVCDSWACCLTALYCYPRPDHRRCQTWFISSTNPKPNPYHYYGRPLSVAWAKSIIFCQCFFMAALFSGGWRQFYTWWTLSVIREVTTLIFSWSSSVYRVGQKVTKFGAFSDPTRKLSALTPERGRIL